jgi:ketosteroid isomerase-like protein
MSNDSEIRTIIESWAVAVRQRDIDGVMAHHADDLLMFDVVGPLQVRGAAIDRWCSAAWSRS